MKTIATIVVALSTLCVAQDGEAPPEPTWPDHPLILPNHKKPVRVELTNGQIEGLVWHDPRRQHVQFSWNYKVLGLTDGQMVLDPTRWKSGQDCFLPYVPTDVACIGENELAVAGLDDAGDSIVQVWTLRSPPTPAVAYDALGNRLVPDLTVSIVSRTTVYREPSGGGKYVGAVLRNWGDPDKPFLFFTNTAELYELDRTTLETRKVASPSDDTVLFVPELSETYDSVASGHHETLGGLYWFLNTGSRANMVFLRDSDLDGELDATDVIDDTTWPTCIYSDSSEYLAFR